MRPFREMSAALCGRVRGVFFDIDDTITTEGRLEASAYQAVERLQQAGLLTIPITGRPAGWCDMIARFWPVDAVVGENGAFSFAYDRQQSRMIRSYAIPEETRLQDQQKLSALQEQILGEVPGCAVSADQPYREADLAIDFCEDVPALPFSQVERIRDLFVEAGAEAKISSIHVNGWFGSYDKLTACQKLMTEQFGVSLEEARDEFLFVGDSPNDEPMFRFFPNACGVANVLQFAETLQHPPTWITEQKSGHGFVELVEHVLARRPALEEG